jgi:hypothetical protein
MFNGGRLPSKHHVLGHDGDTLHVNGTQVGVLKQSNEVSVRSLLEGKYSHALEMTVTLTWTLEQPLIPNVGMVPCESKGQLTFGISGSLKAAIERNVKVVFWVRVWHCVFTIEAHSHWTYRHRARTVPMRLFDASSRWQRFPCRLCH